MCPCKACSVWNEGKHPNPCCQRVHSPLCQNPLLRIGDTSAASAWLPPLAFGDTVLCPKVSDSPGDIVGKTTSLGKKLLLDKKELLPVREEGWDFSSSVLS